MLNIMWWGYGGSKHFAEALRPLIVSMGHKLVTMSEWPDSDIIWNRQTWIQELKKADVIIIPCNYKIQDAKSNNRLTQAMSLGKPVICNPLSAYLKVLEHVDNCCLLAETESDWEIQIRFLESASNRTAISKNALLAASFYSIEAITAKWEKVLSTISDYSSTLVQKNNVAWLSPYNLEACQTRIRVIAVQEYLKHSITTSYDEALKHNIVIVGKSFSERDFGLVVMLILNGNIVIADICEDFIGWPWVDEMLSLCDIVVCCSHRLAEKVRKVRSMYDICDTSTVVIEDAYEKE